MQTRFCTYRVIRISGTYNPDVTTPAAAASEAALRCVSEAESNGLYEGDLNGVAIDEVCDCGESK